MDSDRARERLAQERRRIETALEEHRLDPPGDEPSLSQHVADRGSELFDEEFDESLVGLLRDELRAIERAEQRLADGTYGLSIESGAPIPDERLEAVPWAERTVDEQVRFERGV